MHGIKKVEQLVSGLQQLSDRREQAIQTQRKYESIFLKVWAERDLQLCGRKIARRTVSDGTDMSVLFVGSGGGVLGGAVAGDVFAASRRALDVKDLCTRFDLLHLWIHVVW